jgi:serine phosphatase RsbU (regulator of sigma subunit)
LPITAELHVVVFTDGVSAAGERYGQRLDTPSFLREQVGACSGEMCARALADGLLGRAVELDRGRPSDDISVVVFSVVGRQDSDDVRRLSVRFPI